MRNWPPRLDRGELAADKTGNKGIDQKGANVCLLAHCLAWSTAWLQSEVAAIFDRGQIQTDPPLLHYVQIWLVPVAKHHDYIILKQQP
jgi:hypothetical protein